MRKNFPSVGGSEGTFFFDCVTDQTDFHSLSEKTDAHEADGLVRFRYVTYITRHAIILYNARLSRGCGTHRLEERQLVLHETVVVFNVVSFGHGSILWILR